MWHLENQKKHILSPLEISLSQVAKFSQRKKG
jgi:hypothetical protein